MLPTSHFLKIHLNIILPSTSGSLKWSLSLRFPLQNPVYASLPPHTRYMPSYSHSFRFYHPNNITYSDYKIKVLKIEAACSAETVVGYLSIKVHDVTVTLRHTTARTSYLKIIEHHTVTKDRQTAAHRTSQCGTQVK
jgi:hypothetical protein